MIRSNNELNSTRRLISQLQGEVKQLCEIKEHSYSTDIEKAIDDRRAQIHREARDVAEYQACLDAEHPPAMITVCTESPQPSHYQKGLFLSRLARGVTQVELAERLNCTQGRISRWEGSSVSKQNTSERTPHKSTAGSSDIQMSTVMRWGKALGYSHTSLFIDRTYPLLSVRGLPALSLDLAATIAQFASSTDAAVRSAMRSIRSYSGAECLTCYVPDSRSNVLQLAFCDGIEHVSAMAGVVWDDSVPMALLKRRDRPYGDFLVDVRQHPSFSESLFVIRERIASVVYVVFDCHDSKGILFLNYRRAELCKHGTLLPVLQLLSHLLSFFFTSVTQPCQVGDLPLRLDLKRDREHNWAAAILLNELKRYIPESHDTEQTRTFDDEFCDTYVLSSRNRIRQVPRPARKVRISTNIRRACHAICEFRHEQNQRTLIVDTNNMPQRLSDSLEDIGRPIRGVFASPLPAIDVKSQEMLVGFIRQDSGEEVTKTAYRAITRGHCTAIAGQLMSIRQLDERTRPESSMPCSRKAIINALSMLSEKEPQDRTSSACDIVNELFGAVLTDVWYRDCNETVEGKPLACSIDSQWKGNRQTKTVIDSIRPRPRGLTWRLLNEPQPSPVVIPDAEMDSQSGQGTRSLKLKTIIGVPVLGPASLFAEAIVWIRFNDDVSRFFIEKKTKELNLKRKADLHTISSFMHLLVFSGRYPQLFELTKDLSVDECVEEGNSLINRGVLVRTALLVSGEAADDDATAGDLQ